MASKDLRWPSLTPEQISLVNQYYRLAIHYSRKWSRSFPFDPAEYESRAIFGLAWAAKRYDPARRKPFEYWLFVCVRSKISSWKSSETRRFERRHGRSPIDRQPSTPRPENLPDHRRPGTDQIDCDDLRASIFDLLTDRERTVIDLLAQGFTHAEISERLGQHRTVVTWITGKVREKVLAGSDLRYSLAS